MVRLKELFENLVWKAAREDAGQEAYCPRGRPAAAVRNGLARFKPLRNGLRKGFFESPERAALFPNQKEIAESLYKSALRIVYQDETLM